MLPSIQRRRISTDSSNMSLTPIFSSQLNLSSKEYTKDRSPEITNRNLKKNKDDHETAFEIKRLQSLIAKLKKDNILLKEFILSTKIIHLNKKSIDDYDDPTGKISREFTKLESFISN